MKNTLLCILVLTVAFIGGCKKEEVVNNDPFTNGTTFLSVTDYHIVADTNTNKIISYTYIDDDSTFGTTTISYFGDTMAEITIINFSSPTDTIIGHLIYYLNNVGAADSVITTTHNSAAPNQDATYKRYYQYDANGFVTCISSNPIICIGTTFTYAGNNYSGPLDKYYDYRAKLDVFSHMRSMDNALSGKDDVDLPKEIHTPDFFINYYYQFNSLGYVTSCITVYNNDGIVNAFKKNYSYSFIQ